MKMHVKDFEKDFEAITNVYQVLKKVDRFRRPALVAYVLEILYQEDTRDAYREENRLNFEVEQAIGKMGES